MARVKSNTDLKYISTLTEGQLLELMAATKDKVKAARDLAELSYQQARDRRTIMCEYYLEYLRSKKPLHNLPWMAQPFEGVWGNTVTLNVADNMDNCVVTYIRTTMPYMCDWDLHLSPHSTLHSDAGLKITIDMQHLDEELQMLHRDYGVRVDTFQLKEKYLALKTDCLNLIQVLRRAKRSTNVPGQRT